MKEKIKSTNEIFECNIKKAAKTNVPNGMSNFFFFFVVNTVFIRHASRKENTFNTIQRKLVYCFWRFSTHIVHGDTESVCWHLLLSYHTLSFFGILVQIQGLSSTVACPMRISIPNVYVIQRKLSEIVIIEFNFERLSKNDDNQKLYYEFLSQFCNSNIQWCRKYQVTSIFFVCFFGFYLVFTLVSTIHHNFRLRLHAI